MLVKSFIMSCWFSIFSRYFRCVWAWTTTRTTFATRSRTRLRWFSCFFFSTMLDIVGFSFFLFFNFVLVLLCVLFFCEWRNYLIGLFSTYSINSKFVFDRILGNILKNSIYCNFLIKINKNTSHKSSSFLIYINPRPFNRTILIKSLSNIIICKISIYILYIEAWIFL